jgi:putative transposase
LTRGRVQAVGVPELHTSTVRSRTDKNGLRPGRHCAYPLQAHVVFVTNYRHHVSGDRHVKRMEEVIREVCDDFEVQLVEFDGENNHVHRLVDFPPTLALSRLVNSVKGVSSRRLRQEFPDPAPALLARNGCGPGRTSPDRSAALRCLSCGSTSSSRTVPSRARLGPWRASPRGPSPPP